MTTDKIIERWKEQQREQALLDLMRVRANEELWQQVCASTSIKTVVKHE
jgi:hypothetical protein